MPELDLDGIRITRDTGAAILLMQAGMYTLDSYSTLNSSPWTAESFGGDPDKLNSLREYIAHAVVVSSLYCGGAAWLAERWWPIIGASINNLYLVWLYDRAARRAQVRGSTSWS